MISIHAPRVGSDYLGLALFQTFGISIHAPRVGSDPSVLGAWCRGHNFNPRSPCGERPYTAARHAYHRIFQSTLPVWGATSVWVESFVSKRISIHAPRVGSDSSSCIPRWMTPNFNPRSPCGERLADWSDPEAVREISIHAPRVGSDLLRLPRSASFALFQSTLPVWGATCRLSPACALRTISIHAPRVGSDGPLAAVQLDVVISIHAPRVGSDQVES